MKLNVDDHTSSRQHEMESNDEIEIRKEEGKNQKRLILIMILKKNYTFIWALFHVETSEDWRILLLVTASRGRTTESGT